MHIEFCPEIVVTQQYWGTDYKKPYVVRIWMGWQVLVEAVFGSAAEAEVYAHQMRLWRDGGRLAITRDEHGVPYLEYVQQRDGNFALLRQFEFRGKRSTPRWVAPEEEVNDRLFWLSEVENAPAEAEA